MNWLREGQELHLLEKILERIEHIEQEIEKMAQVQLSIGFTVAPGTVGQPLTVTPASVNEDLTAGVAADGTVVATASGGTPPYAFTLDSTSGPLPPGITLALNPTSGVLTLVGTPTTPSTSVEQVLVDITDAALASGAQLRSKTPTTA